MAATFRAEGEAFELTVTAGQVFGSSIDGGTARIPDLSLAKPTVHIETRLSGAAENGLRFLHEGILAERFGNFAGALEATGAIEVDLNVLAPLPVGKKQADGNITLLGNTLALKEVDITLTDIKGQLSFTPAGMSASAIEAIYLDTPISIDVARSQPGNTELLVPGLRRQGISTASTPHPCSVRRPGRPSSYPLSHQRYDSMASQRGSAGPVGT